MSKKSLYAVTLERLPTVPLDESFFLQGVTANQAHFIRKAGYALGIRLQIVQTEKDEIYLLPGVRIWNRGDLKDKKVEK